MARLVAVESITLDGVMQAPGRPDEDTRGGFEHGGWAIPYNDEVMGQEMGKRMAQGGPLVLGSGQRLFPDGVFERLQLTDSVTTTTGVVIATYRPAEAAGGGS